MINLIKNTLINLKGHTLRVIVALIWIIIGITSVVIVTSVGNGFQKQIEASLDFVNERKTYVYFQQSSDISEESSSFLQPFSNSDIETLSFIDGVEKITSDDGNYGTELYFQANYLNKATDIIVRTQEVSHSNSSENEDNTSESENNTSNKEPKKVTILEGRNISVSDEKTQVIVITKTNAIDLFGSEKNAIGKGINISGLNFEVIGVLDDSIEEINNDILFSEVNYDSALVPKYGFNSLKRLSFDPYTSIYQLNITAKTGYDIFDVANRVIDKLNELHQGINGTYMMPDPKEKLQVLEDITNNVNKFVSIVTIISMCVGGIGVMNIMYVSVMERRKEIGIRRALGAKPRAILFQFIFEALLITITGGILGIISGFFSINYVAKRVGFQPIISLNTFAFAVITIVLTGVIFGLIPAYKAAKVDPIQAIYK
jgi:putative ABC transport system permease protein